MDVLFGILMVTLVCSMIVILAWSILMVYDLGKVRGVAEVVTATCGLKVGDAIVIPVAVPPYIYSALLEAADNHNTTVAAYASTVLEEASPLNWSSS